eukprot:jgi/Tetstr1/459925/TSEL_005265.t1
MASWVAASLMTARGLATARLGMASRHLLALEASNVSSPSALPGALFRLGCTRGGLTAHRAAFSDEAKPSPGEDTPPAGEGEADKAAPGAGAPSRWRNWVETRLGEMEKDTAASGGGNAAAEAPEVQSAVRQMPKPADAGPAVVGTEDGFADLVRGYAQLGKISRSGIVAPLEVGGEAEVPEGSEVPTPMPSSPPRISPFRVFYPGQLYEPEDLNPFRKLDSDGQRVEWRAQHQRPVDAEVREMIDFKNQEFLSAHVTDMGQLLPRRRTRLKKSTHRKLMRAIKLARCMALLPTTSKLPQFSRQKNPYTSRSR